ncbi:MAG: hypothetical protein HGA60_08140 [Chlorobiaceae bacterium]|nr:hypothetical protein [Chlorobiaceae bacterium]
MTNGIRFSYLYRDAGNYKAWGSVDFTNPDELSVEVIERKLRDSFDQQELFIAHQLGLPELFFYADEPVTGDDHCYHEFAAVEGIELTDTKIPERSITEFLTEVQACADKGWAVFHPADRLDAIRASRLPS